jgi:hypothetical protein
VISALQLAENRLRDGGTFPIKGETWSKIDLVLSRIRRGETQMSLFWRSTEMTLTCLRCGGPVDIPNELADALALLRELNDALLPIPNSLQDRIDAILDKTAPQK